MRKIFIFILYNSKSFILNSKSEIIIIELSLNKKYIYIEIKYESH